MSDIAITQALGFASLVFTGILSYFMFRAKSASELAVIQANAASAAAIAAANKVETVAATVEAGQETKIHMLEGVVADVVDVKRTLAVGSARRDKQLNAVVAKVEDVAVVVAEVKKTTAEIHVLSDGMMSNALATGLEAAQGRYDAVPTPENKAKLEAAQKKVEEHAAKEKLIETKQAGAK